MREEPSQRAIIARTRVLAHAEVQRELRSENDDCTEDEPRALAAEGNVSDDVLEGVCDFIKT